jgi:formate dehydrogenase major subunit
MTRRTNNLKIVNEDILLVNKEDADKRDLNTGDIARLYSARGEVSLMVEVTNKVKKGIVFTTFHFPEHMVNMVTGHGKDEETLCAEYKVSAVEVQKISNKFTEKAVPDVKIKKGASA